MSSVPAVSIEAVLAGLAANGQDTVVLRARLGLAPHYEDPAEHLPAELWKEIWRAAALADPRSELPSLVGLRVPFALFGAPVMYGAPRYGFDVPTACLDATPGTADAGLHAVLREVSRKLDFHPEVSGSFELAVRARLRELLPRGEAGAQRVARALGMSERTLHRRLGEGRTTFRALVDAFRIGESERLLLDGRRSLVEIALSLGFSDQTTWNRFFRRIEGCSPTEWLAQRHDRSA